VGGGRNFFHAFRFSSAIRSDKKKPRRAPLVGEEGLSLARTYYSEKKGEERNHLSNLVLTPEPKKKALIRGERKKKKV